MATLSARANPGQMKQAPPFTTLSLAIGGVLLTDGWGHNCFT